MVLNLCSSAVCKYIIYGCGSLPWWHQALLVALMPGSSRIVQTLHQQGACQFGAPDFLSIPSGTVLAPWVLVLLTCNAHAGYLQRCIRVGCHSHGIVTLQPAALSCAVQPTHSPPLSLHTSSQHCQLAYQPRICP